MLTITCLKIFAARILDVSLGTIRTNYFVKGKTIEPFIIAFFEVLIWYAVAKEALNTEANTIAVAISYSLGYATGTFIGSKISKSLIKGTVGVEVIVNENSDSLIDEIRNKGYAVSIIELKNVYDGNNKDMLFLQVSSKKLKELTSIIQKFDESAFIIINETKKVYNGYLK